MPPASVRPSTGVIVGLALAIVLDTCIQLAWKLAAGHTGEGAGTFHGLAAVLLNPWFALAMLAFAAQLWNWLRVLSRADLSFVQPFTALSYISVLGLSALWLHERISGRQGLGVCLILMGVWFISRTPAVSAPAGAVTTSRQP